MEYIKIEIIKEKLKKDLLPKRYEHTMRTVLKAVELAIDTEADINTVFCAALLHDCAKYKTPDANDEALLNDFIEFQPIFHAPYGAIIAQREYGITDEKVLNAIRYHSTGRKNMSIEEMIVCLADAIEDGREYPNLDIIRKNTHSSIKKGLLTYLRNVVNYETSRGNKIHHLTLEAIEDLEKTEEI